MTDTSNATWYFCDVCNGRFAGAEVFATKYPEFYQYAGTALSLLQDDLSVPEQLYHEKTKTHYSGGGAGMYSCQTWVTKHACGPLRAETPLDYFIHVTCKGT